MLPQPAGGNLLSWPSLLQGHGILVCAFDSEVGKGRQEDREFVIWHVGLCRSIRGSLWHLILSIYLCVSCSICASPGLDGECIIRVR